MRQRPPAAISRLMSFNTELNSPMKHKIQPDYAIHPGETLAETIERLGISQAELARRTGRSTRVISEIIRGKRAIKEGTALLRDHLIVPRVFQLQ